MSRDRAIAFLLGALLATVGTWALTSRAHDPPRADGRPALASDGDDLEAGRPAAAAGGSPSSPEQAAAEPGAAEPGAAEDPGRDASPAELRRYAEALAAERTRMRERVVQLRGQVDALERRLGDEAAPLGERHWYPTSPEEQAQLLEDCTLRLDQPPVQGMEPAGLEDDFEAMDLQPGEDAILEDAVARLHRTYLETLRPLYVEATGDATGVSSLSPRALLAELRDKAARDGNGEGVMRRVSRERAGLEPPPGDPSSLSPYEQAFRAFVDLGDDLQALVAQSTGAERAHALRAASGGWPWSRSQFTGCGR